ncbi:MAG: vWA domain-containing protein [Paludibacteraceae bacterium]
MTFHNPEYLFLLLVLIPIGGWYWWKMRNSDASIQISSIDRLKTLPKTKRLKFKHLPFVLRMLAIITLIFAIARPQASSSWRSETTEGIDIMMALDISGTMQAEDLRPNRLEAAKSVASEFIISRPNDNIGLVAFAAESFTMCPLTINHNVLLNLFASVKYGMLPDGTAIGLGLANAVNRVKEGKAKSKVVILLTDGSNNQGDIAPATAAEIGKTFGIRVYAIGIGSYGMVNIPVPTPFGIRYQQMKSEFDEGTLKEIANKTGGKYFRATNNAKLREIYQEIDKLEKTKIDVKEFSNKTELFHIFAMLAFLFLFTEILLKNSWFRSAP